MINERKLDNIIKNVITEMGRRKQTIGFPDGFGPYGRRQDTVKGTYLRHSPEDLGFLSNEPWNRAETYDDNKMNELIDNALTSLCAAREYAGEQGNGDMYMLLNSIVAELNLKKTNI